ncbi:MAG: hypothetical protein Kow00121_22180 [Elainellaceae cyanobacterium]
MSEKAVRTKFIKDFLVNVRDGSNFIEDIWIEREIRSPEETGERYKQVSKAYSLSGNTVTSTLELIEDDLKFTFEEGYFAFRLISASPGSGKTTLLQFLDEYLRTKNNYQNRSIVASFRFSALLPPEDGQTFFIKIYSYLLAITFWEILRSEAVKPIAEKLLKELFSNDVFISLNSIVINNLSFDFHFLEQFKEYFLKSGRRSSPENLFFYVLDEVLKVENNFTFVYLIDDLDSLGYYDDKYTEETIALLRSLVSTVFDKKYRSKLRLMIYLAGVSDSAERFFNKDASFKSRIQKKVINLLEGRNDEYEKIKQKIDRRIKGAYSNSQKLSEIDNFIQGIPFENYSNLRDFCQSYASEILRFYEQLLKDIPETYFDGDDETLLNLIKLECERKWNTYLQTPNKYKFEQVLVPKKSNDYTFLGAARLVEDNHDVANAYVGARNYELLSQYVEEFLKQLKVHNFSPFDSTGRSKDIALIVAPKCSFLLQEKLKANNVHFIDSSELTRGIGEVQAIEGTSSICLPVDVNLADEKQLSQVFKDFRLGPRAIDSIFKGQPYKNGLDDLCEVKENNRRIFGAKRRTKLESMIREQKICFRIGAFISYNSRDKSEVDRLVGRIERGKIWCWKDDQLPGGTDIRIELEKKIESDMVWSAVIFIGNHGIGRWQEEEISALLRKLVERGHPVIPVVLNSHASGEPNVKGFLANKERIDLRKQETTQLKRLIQSIKTGHIR